MSRPRKIDYDEARRLVASGLSRSEVARHFGCSLDVVTRACDEFIRLRHIEDAKARNKRNWQSHRDSQSRYEARMKSLVASNSTESTP